MKYSHRKQKGFSILSVILVIVAVIVVISIWAFSGNSNINSDSKDEVLVSSLINDSQIIKNEFDRLVIAGNLASNIVFLPNTASTRTAPNMLDPTVGISIPKINSSLLKQNMVAPKAMFVYTKKLSSYYLNSATNTINQPDYMVLVSGLRDSVCERINKQLYGDEITTDALIVDPIRYITGATISNPNFPGASLNVVTFPEDVNDKQIGCFKSPTTEDDSMFFRILKMN